MAAQYYLYCTTLNNTVICRGDNSFAPLPPNTGELYYDILIPETQPLYLYRESGSSIVFNSQENIEEYVQETLPPPTMDDYVTHLIFDSYSGVTVPETYVSKSLLNIYTGTTAPASFVNVGGDTMTGSLSTTANLIAGGLVSGSSICGGVWLHSPIVCADTCIRSGAICSLGAVSAASTLNVSGNTYFGSKLYIQTQPASGSTSDYTLYWNPTTKEVKASLLTGGTSNYHYFECFTPASTTQTTCQLYLRYTANTFTEGRYQVDFDTAIKNSATNRCSLVSFKIDGVTQGIDIIQHGTAHATPMMMRDVELTSGLHCFDIYYWSQAGTSTIYYGSIRAKKIG